MCVVHVSFTDLICNIVNCLSFKDTHSLSVIQRCVLYVHIKWYIVCVFFLLLYYANPLHANMKQYRDIEKSNNNSSYLRNASFIVAIKIEINQVIMNENDIILYSNKEISLVDFFFLARDRCV